MKPYLSTRINDPDYADLMFYDWGVFHFHLGTKPHPKHNGFIKRTGELLFAITEQSTATIQTPSGRCLVPMGGGITLAGTSTQNRIKANRMRMDIMQFENQIIQNREALENQFKTKYRKDWDNLKFKLTSFGAVVRVEEVTTGEVVVEQG